MIVSRMEGSLIKKTAAIVVIAAALSGILFYIIYHVPLVYNTLGIRVKSLFQILSGNRSSINEGSTQYRQYLIRYGLNLFKQRPVLGWGLEGFRNSLGSETGRYTFSHNNYVELLANFGLAGCLLYYSMHLSQAVNLLPRLRKQTGVNRKEDKDYIILAIGILGGILVGDYFLVLYYQKAEFLFIALIASIIRINKDREKLSSGIK
jgi:O-antigen ligase